MKLFVPGRICLFGEHSDWAGGYRRINADIEKGLCLITGTNQGIYADVEPHPSRLVMTATLEDGTSQGPVEVPMEASALLKVAEEGGFFSYAAGVAYQVMTNYRVRGLKIHNYRTDLPVKKGLSSSAAVCVMVARAFNRIYDLKLTVRGEMELAYLGEITTPSRCGRMDQGCAYGSRPILMTVDGERIDVEEVSVPRDMHFLIVDLHAGKDTREILNRLNHCYPFAEDTMSKNVQKCLGPLNKSIVTESVEALRAGNAARLGELMKKAQEEFDKHVAPACPTQLTAPVLHKLLSYPGLREYVYGGKGVGSQGDGSAQFICRDAASLEKASSLIKKQFGMSCLPLVLHSARRVRKAIIPAAGYGTRLFPATKAVKKELFPVIDSSGRAKPVILAIVEEVLRSGIEEVAIIVQSADRELFQEVFNTPPPIDYFNKLSRDDQRYCGELLDIGNRITFLAQDVQEGFGHAVYCAREWVGNEPFLLLLGDHLYASDSDTPCARQLLNVYEQVGRSVVGVKVTPGSEVSHFGCVTGMWEKRGQQLSVTEFSEKPDLETARKHLRMEGMQEDSFLTVFGQYVLSPKIFDYLEEHIRLNMRERGEFQLTSCLDRMRQEDGFTAWVVQGRRFDIGMPDAYRQTVTDFRNA